MEQIIDKRNKRAGRFPACSLIWIIREQIISFGQFFGRIVDEIDVVIPRFQVRAQPIGLQQGPNITHAMESQYSDLAFQSVSALLCGFK